MTGQGTRLLCGCLTALTLACAFSPLAVASPPPELTVLGQGPVEVNAQAGEDTTEAFVSVLNTSKTESKVSVGFQASSSASVKATLIGPTVIKSGQAANVAVRFSGLKELTESVTGQIVIQGGLKPVAQGATITPALQPYVEWPVVIIGASMGGALLLLLMTAACVGDRRGSDGSMLLSGPAPGPKWSFDSWATHLTAVGGILGSVAGVATLPAVPMQIDKESVVALSILFAGIATIGPFVFQAIRKPDAKASEEEEGNWGYVWGLLIACWLTLGAVFGELATLGLVAWVIVGNSPGAIVLEVGLGIVVVLAAYYVVTTAYSLAMVDWRSVAAKAKPITPSGKKEAKKGKKAKPARAGAFSTPIDSGVEPTFQIDIRREVAHESSRASRHLDIGSDGQAQRMTLRLP